MATLPSTARSKQPPEPAPPTVLDDPSTAPAAPGRVVAITRGPHGRWSLAVDLAGQHRTHHLGDAGHSNFTTRPLPLT